MSKPKGIVTRRWPEEVEHRLRALLPHLGGATGDTRIAMGMRVVENVKAFCAGETPRDRVV